MPELLTSPWDTYVPESLIHVHVASQALRCYTTRDDVDALEIPACTEDEPRFLVTGKIDGKHWSAAVTYRGDRIRIISVHRSREVEVKLYEGE